jgi:hypothetical protein
MVNRRYLFIPILFLHTVFLAAQSQVIYRGYEQEKGTGNFVVHVRLHVPNLSGMVRYTEFIPEEAEVNVINKGKSDVRIEKGKLKFIWTEFPACTDLELTYLISKAKCRFPDYEGKLDYLGTDGLKTAVTLLKENRKENPRPGN